MTTCVKRTWIAAAIMLALTGSAVAESDMYGVIEIGGKGIRGAVVQVLPTADHGQQMEIRAKLDPKNKTAIDPSMTKEVARAVSEMFEKMRAEFLVPAKHIYIVGSSGLASASSRNALAERVQAATGKTIEFVDVQQESELTFRGTVPMMRLKGKEVVVIDIGSSNIKGSYVEDTEEKKVSFASFGIPLGTEVFVATVDANRAPNEAFAEVADRFRQAELIPLVRQQRRLKPGLQNLDRVYLAGGIPWVLATLMHPDSQGPFVRLSTEDIITFRNRATRNSDALFQIDLGNVTDPDKRATVRSQIDKIRRGQPFSREHLIAGAEILKGLSDELGFAGKKLYFVRDAQYAWILGYLQSKITSPEEEIEESANATALSR
jgi:hypothetical protein